MEYAELHVRTYKKLKRWVSFIISHAIVVKFVHLYGQNQSAQIGQIMDMLFNTI